MHSYLRLDSPVSGNDMTEYTASNTGTGKEWPNLTLLGNGKCWCQHVQSPCLLPLFFLQKMKKGTGRGGAPHAQLMVHLADHPVISLLLSPVMVETWSPPKPCAWKGQCVSSPPGEKTKALNPEGSPKTS